MAGYLLAEVLERQPAEVRELLLRTSVLDRVSGPLADFLSGGIGFRADPAGAGGQPTRLCPRWTWAARGFATTGFSPSCFSSSSGAPPRNLVSLAPGGRPMARAGGIHCGGGPSRAVGARLVSASRLLPDHHIDLTLDGRPGTVWQLLGTFPDDIVAADPELALVFATARLMGGEREKCAAYLDLAQRLADMVPEEHRRRFDVMLAVLRLLLARWRGDLETVLEASRAMEAALGSMPAGERALSDRLRSVALQNLGVAELWSARLDDARRDLEQALGWPAGPVGPGSRSPASVTSGSPARGRVCRSPRGFSSARRR